jgi:hypothetical protein
MVLQWEFSGGVCEWNSSSTVWDKFVAVYRDVPFFYSLQTTRCVPAQTYFTETGSIPSYGGCSVFSTGPNGICIKLIIKPDHIDGQASLF